MPRIVFEINYDIKPDTRDAYLETVKELSEHLKSSGKNYRVIEDMNTENNFTEVYILNDEAEYEAMDDETDDRTQELTTKILSEFVSGNSKYSTFREVMAN